MEIRPVGTQASYYQKDDHFTGKVRVDPLFNPPAPARVRGSAVTFEPGARTFWHAHPLGQTLIVTAGCGWVQKEGEPVHEIKPGDVVYIGPNEKHWHGATDKTAMTHIAIVEHINEVSATWMEQVGAVQSPAKG